AFVVHGAGGIDELSPIGPSFVCEVVDGGVRERTIDPEQLGVERCSLEALAGGAPAENAAAIQRVFGGEHGGPRDAILLNGADAVLLILRDLDDAVCAHLLAYAKELGLDALVEAHDADELQRAMQLDAPVIGINARDLSTFEIDRRAQLELVARAPRDRIVIAESGVHTRAQG